MTRVDSLVVLRRDISVSSPKNSNCWYDWRVEQNEVSLFECYCKRVSHVPIKHKEVAGLLLIYNSKYVEQGCSEPCWPVVLSSCWYFWFRLHDAYDAQFHSHLVKKSASYGDWITCNWSCLYNVTIYLNTCKVNGGIENGLLDPSFSLAFSSDQTRICTDQRMRSFYSSTWPRCFAVLYNHQTPESKEQQLSGWTPLPDVVVVRSSSFFLSAVSYKNLTRQL